MALTLQQHVGSLVCILLWIKFRGALYALILSMILHNSFVDKIRAMKKCTQTLKAKSDFFFLQVRLFYISNALETDARLDN